MTKKLVLCDCLGSQNLDVERIASGSGLACSKVYTNLCGNQIEQAAKEIASGETIIACQQERPRFEELAEELSLDFPGFVDLRDRAGWGEGDPTAKMAALASEASLALPLGKSVDVISEGTCLIIGDVAALAAADDLCGILAVTVLLSPGTEIPADRRFDCVFGTLRQVSGALGGFSVKIDNFQMMQTGGRGGFTMTDPQKTAVSNCDIILDLSGDAPLVPAPEKREGYLRAEPNHAPSVAQVVLSASQLVGTFEKPLYVSFEENLCAHSRAEQPACSNCLNVCPTGAITSAGEHVAIDPMVCAGCGACSAVCPSGAISYDAPSVASIFRRLETLASTYRKMDADQPRLLVHDASYGIEMISLSARFGLGLPHNVIPFEIDALSGFGHAEMLAALACGFRDVALLLSPSSETQVINEQVALCDAIAGESKVILLDINDPDALSAAFKKEIKTAPSFDPVFPIGSRRQVTRLAAKALNTNEELIELPDGAPYGSVVVDTDACTLCLSCVSLCPSGALADNPDMPQLRFQEDACLQCGLCTNICPENAISLKPQMDLSDSALSQRIIHEEEPFACIECGALFGVKSTVEKISEKLAGSHSMFATSEASKMIQMCDNCRIQAQFHSTDNPFQGNERPRVRTTDDYLSKRKDH